MIVEIQSFKPARSAQQNIVISKRQECQCAPSISHQTGEIEPWIDLPSRKHPLICLSVWRYVQGFSNVVVLEKSDRLGGRLEDIDLRKLAQPLYGELRNDMKSKCANPVIAKGASIFDVRNIFGFFDPLSPCRCYKSADVVPFVCFLGTPPPPTHCGRHIGMPPNEVFWSQF